MIANDLQFEDLVNFQKSSTIALAATSDVSFYCRYLTDHCPYDAIDTAYFYKDMITNLVISDITNDALQEKVSELRRDNPELAKPEHWHFFEDVFYAKLHSLEFGWDAEIIELEDFNALLENLNFAEKMDYKTLQHELANQIIYGVFGLVALGSMDYEQGAEHIARLMQKVRFLAHASTAGSCMIIATKRTLPVLVKLYEHLLKRIIREWRFDCTWFFWKLCY